MIANDFDNPLTLCLSANSLTVKHLHIQGGLAPNVVQIFMVPRFLHPTEWFFPEFLFSLDDADISGLLGFSCSNKIMLTSNFNKYFSTSLVSLFFGLNKWEGDVQEAS